MKKNNSVESELSLVSFIFGVISISMPFETALAFSSIAIVFGYKEFNKDAYAKIGVIFGIISIIINLVKIF